MNDHPTDSTGAPITSYVRAELEILHQTKRKTGNGPFTYAQITAELDRRDAINRRPRDERHA